MTENPENREPKARTWTLTEKAALAAIAVNVFLTVLKFGLAWWSKSLALRVEAYHSLADVGSSVAVFLAVYADTSRSRVPARAGKLHGIFGNPQRLVAVFIGAFLLAVGLLFLRKIVTPETITVTHPLPASIAMLCLALFSFLLSRFELIVGEKEKSTALVADSYHSRVDMFGSLIVAGSLLGESLGWKVDRLAAGLLAVFVLSQAVNVFGAVIRDMARREERPELFYRDEFWLAVQRRLPALIPRVVEWTTRITGGSLDSKRDRNKAKAVLTAAVTGLLLCAYLASGFFEVRPNEKVIVERLGRPLNAIRPLDPGLHWCWPRPIDRVRRVDVKGIRTLNVGSAVSPERRTVLWTNQHYVEQFNLLTGENIFVDVGVVVHYRIADAAAWLYAVDDPERMLSSVAYSVLAEEFSGLEFLETITTGRDELEARLAARVVDSLARYRAGIDVLTIQVRDIHPPTNVAADFENVVSATIEYETKLNQARGYANDLIPRARGDAAFRVLSAEAERLAGRNRAAGDIELFNGLLAAYRLSPATTRIRLKIETAESVLPGREKIIVPADAVSGAVELFAPIKTAPAAGTEKAEGDSQ
jgi:membrane protease subunit HflK